MCLSACRGNERLLFVKIGTFPSNERRPGVGTRKFPRDVATMDSTYTLNVLDSSPFECVGRCVCVCVVKTFAAGTARGCACVKAHVSNEKQRIRNGKNCMPSGIWCIGYSFTVTGLFVDRWWAFVNNVIGYNFQIHWIFLGYHVFKRWPSNQHTKLLNVYYTYVYIIILCIYYVYIMYILCIYYIYNMYYVYITYILYVCIHYSYVRRRIRLLDGRVLLGQW